MEIKHHTKLTAKERDLIAVWRGGKVGVREIARRLRRSHSTIVEEIRRNRFGQNYIAIYAQGKTEERKKKARARHPLKDAETYAYVLEKLSWGWSPEQIAGRLKRENNNQPVICPETIYRFIYAGENKKRKLWECLPLKRAKRRRKYGRTVWRERIPNKISIHDRPEEIDQRIEFGHWEGDTVVGRGKRECLRTEVERVSRFLAAQKIVEATAEQTVLAQTKIFGALPDFARRTDTVDNGLEHTNHQELKDTLGIPTYFADPYCSWQRGTNENTNGLIRRYLPKGSSFTDLTQEELNDIVWEINNRPRKVHDYLTNQEVFDSYLSGRIQLRM